MRSHLLWFLAGCVVGAVALYAILWRTGVLAPYLAEVNGQVSRPAPVPREGPPPPKTVETKATAPPLAEARPSGEIIPPIEGLKVSDIRDSFYESRPGGKPHEATDIMEPTGTPVHAMVDGFVKKLFLSKPGGITIYEFDRAEEFCYYYAHLDRYAEGLAEGQQLTRGTVIGYVGKTGDAARGDPHLHLAISRLGPDKRWWKGSYVNPYPILLNLLGH